jgi:hypothetical protein
MPAANTTSRSQRTAIMSSKLGELEGFELHIDCRSPGCRGERAYAVLDLARYHGAGVTVAQALYRMRCRHCGRKPPRAAWIVTGPVLNKKVRPRRIALLSTDGPD